MKLFSFTLVTIGVSNAAPGLWEQCRSQNGTEIGCDKGLVCVPDVEHYGLCYTKVVEESAQCGGLGWNVNCVNGTTCSRQNEGWATCKSAVDNINPAAEWQECNLEDSDKACANDLICVDDDDYRGLCVKEVAEVWGQCGGSGWTTDCESGSSCMVKTATYSQCVPDDSQSGETSSGNNSLSEDQALTAASIQNMGALAVFVDMSSLLKPLAQLHQIAAAVKKMPCSFRMVFTETTCKDDEQTGSST
ncbi:hypothetical protein JG688_00012495 [Phytophthora aleatoria]|uniref:CBM1 domain-containing protein n=1 Tax=Phytophthora aleatoria TaxID=2496075 RepID=A0A8J5MEQ3_9STRA|nr:hypothetical protein JG688_00012495 [Phytophthora aleatoria]